MAQRSASKLDRIRSLSLGAALVIGFGATIYCLRRYLDAEKRSAAPAAGHPLGASTGAAEPTAGLRLAQILIPVANPATARGLIQLAGALGARQPPSELIALKIVTAPKGVPLEEARHYMPAMREHYEGALAEAAGYAEEQGVALRTELQVAREVAGGILAAAENLPQLDLLLLGWRGPVSLRRVQRSINREVIGRVRTNVAVLHGREPGPLRRVLVPVGWGPHARLGLRLAERLAHNAGAAVTVLRILPLAGEVDWEAERATLAGLLAAEAPSLRYDTEMRLVREPAVVPAILAEAQRVSYDLLIIGGSDEGWLRNWLFGAIPDQVAEQAPCSVLLVRHFEERSKA